MRNGKPRSLRTDDGSSPSGRWLLFCPSADAGDVESGATGYDQGESRRAIWDHCGASFGLIPRGLGRPRNGPTGLYGRESGGGASECRSSTSPCGVLTLGGCTTPREARIVHDVSRQVHDARRITRWALGDTVRTGQSTCAVLPSASNDGDRPDERCRSFQPLVFNPGIEGPATALTNARRGPANGTSES